MDNLKNLFTKQHGLFFKSLQFETIVIFLFVIFFFTYYFKNSYGFVIILIVFSLFISSSYVDVKKEELSDFNKITLVKLQKLQTFINSVLTNKLRSINKKILTPLEKQKIYKSNVLDSLYIDANMIHFLESILPMAKYNETQFLLILNGTNNILKIKNEIDTYYNSNKKYPENTSELFQTANNLKINVINDIHEFIYTIPKNQIMRNYLRDIINRYSVLIGRITDSIHESYKNNIKQRGINASTNFVSYDETKPFDQLSNHSTIPELNNNKLQRFYI
jgi:hypothetical protein